MTAGDGQKKWSRIGCSDDGSLVYVELENGIAYRSKDFGVSWTKLSSPACNPSSLCFISVSGDGKYIYKASFAFLLRSSDSGQPGKI